MTFIRVDLDGQGMVVWLIVGMGHMTISGKCEGFGPTISERGVQATFCMAARKCVSHHILCR